VQTYGKYVFIALALTLLTQTCINEDQSFCSYQPQGQNFTICFNVENDSDRDSAKTACSNLSSQLQEDPDGCTATDVQGFCINANIDSQLSALSAPASGIESKLSFSMYGTDATVNKNFCSTELGGEYRTN